MMTPIGLNSGMSTGRIDRTGATSAGIWEWNTGTSRVLL